MIIDITKSESIDCTTEYKTIEVSGNKIICRKSHGYEYMIMSDDKETTGYPIFPIIHFASLGKHSYLVDNAGIIWHENMGIFERQCRGACLSYIAQYWNKIDAELINAISKAQNDKFCASFINS